jgi:hypothetical protein
MNAPLNISAVSIDTLGTLLAQIADLTSQADMIKDSIKDQASLGGAKVVEGSLFKATYIETNRTTIDWVQMFANKVGVEIAPKEKAEESWKKIAMKIGFDANNELPTAIAKNSKTSAVYSVKVTSK